MKKLFFITGIMLVISIPSKAQSADDIINQYINAIGGIDKIKSINTMIMTGSIDIGGGIQVPFINYLKRPGLMKIETTFQGMTQQIAVDTKSGWQINPFMGSNNVVPMDDDSYKIMKEQADFDGRMVDYREKGYSAGFRGQEDMDGISVNKIMLENKEGEVITYYFDGGTSLLLKQLHKFKLPGSETETQTVFGDYKMEGGLMMAHDIRSSFPGQEEPQKLIIDKVEINVPIDDAIFKAPLKPEDTTK